MKIILTLKFYEREQIILFFTIKVEFIVGVVCCYISGIFVHIKIFVHRPLDSEIIANGFVCYNWLRKRLKIVIACLQICIIT